MIMNNITDLNIEDTPYDIIIVAGQSNAEGNGRSFFTDIFPYYLSYKNVKMIRRKANTEAKTIGDETYCSVSFEDKYIFGKAKPFMRGRYGFYLYFSKFYRKDLLCQGRELLILHTAVGGTSFTREHWGKGEILIENSIKIAQKILSLNAENRVVGILWHQGEGDVLAKAEEEYYYAKLKELLNNYRESLEIPELPIILGDMQNEWKKSQSCAENITNANKRVVLEDMNTAFVDSIGLKGNSKRDTIHFSKVSQKELGKRYYEKFKLLLK